MTALDGLGRLAARSVQPCPDVLRARARGCHGLHVRLVTIGDDLVWDHPGARDGLTEERLGAGRVPVVAEQDIDDLAILIDGSV